jgi:hypothetical protein
MPRRSRRRLKAPIYGKRAVRRTLIKHTWATAHHKPKREEEAHAHASVTRFQSGFESSLRTSSNPPTGCHNRPRYRSSGYTGGARDHAGIRPPFFGGHRSGT